MVHTFKALGQTMALDVESGAVHVIDDAVAAVIAQYPSGFDAARAACGYLADFDEIWRELQTLEQAGMLFTPNTDVDMPPHAPVVKAMCLHVAHDCDLRCGYCFAHTGDFGGGRLLMPLEVGMRALDFLIQNSGARRHLEVDFFGGEPMLNLAVVKQLVAYGRALEVTYNKEIAFTLTTNAHAIPAEEDAWINAEISNLVLSVDGRPAVHDALRPNRHGQGSYAAVLANSRRITATRQKDWYVRGTFTHYNLDFTNDVQSLLDEGLTQLSLEPVVTTPNRPYAITPGDLPVICKEYETLAAHYDEHRRTGKPYTFFHFMVDCAGGPCLVKRLLGCGAGVEYVAVTPEGELYPCHQFVGIADYCMGNVMDNTWDEGIRTRMKSCNVTQKPVCQACFAKYFCSGGCAANAVLMNGDLAKPYEQACILQRKRVECALGLHVMELQ